jgi:hypothetical protein
MLKRYLGRTSDLTAEHLEEVALQLTAPSVSSAEPELSAEGLLQEQSLRQTPSLQAESFSAQMPVPRDSRSSGS